MENLRSEDQASKEPSVLATCFSDEYSSSSRGTVFHFETEGLAAMEKGVSTPTRLGEQELTCCIWGVIMLGGGGWPIMGLIDANCIGVIPWPILMFIPG